MDSLTESFGPVLRFFDRTNVKDRPTHAPAELIGRHLHTSATTYEFTLQHSGITQKIVDQIPAGALVVEAGSGLKQEFVRGLIERRPDLKVIGIDPTLELSPRCDNVILHLQGDAYVYTVDDSPVSHTEQTHFEYFQTLRQTDARDIRRLMRGAIAPEMTGLGVKPDTVTLWIDVNGPNLALHNSEFLDYLRKVVTLLKSGGNAHLYPIGIADSQGKTLLFHRTEVIAAILEQVKTALSGVSVEMEYTRDGLQLHIHKS